MSEGTSAESMVEMLNEYFELMVETIFKYEGTLDKFMGDGIMALLGRARRAPATTRSAACSARSTRWRSSGSFNRKRIEREQAAARDRHRASTPGPLVVGLRRQLEGALVHGHRRHGEHERAPLRERARRADHHQRGDARRASAAASRSRSCQPRTSRARRSRCAVFNVMREKLSAAREGRRGRLASRRADAWPRYVLPFEKPVVELVTPRPRAARARAERPRARARAAPPRGQGDAGSRASSSPTSRPWQKVQLSRHPNRPYTLDYIERLFDGLRRAARRPRASATTPPSSPASARYRGRSRRRRRPPEGARHEGEGEAQLRACRTPRATARRCRLYELASRFGLPILTFIDTPGAYPGIGAEERGQSEAIGACLAAMARARVPIVATIIGEGGSGGALALGVANRVLVLEYGTYSVISPEGLRLDPLEGRRARPTRPRRG